MTLIPFIYDHHLFWFNIHTVIDQYVSLSGDISLQLAAIHVRFQFHLASSKVPCIHMHKDIWMNILQHHII